MFIYFNRTLIQLNMKSKYNFPFDDEVIFIDLDVNNPACKDNPFVRIGTVDHYPLTSEEYASFITSHPVIGKLNDVFPEGITHGVAIHAYAEHNKGLVIAELYAHLMETGKRDLLLALSSIIPEEEEE